MKTITAEEARSGLSSLIDEQAALHQPLLITGVNNKAVLISEEYWHAIQETVALLSIPGMRESILEGMAQSIDEYSEDLAAFEERADEPVMTPEELLKSLKDDG